MAFSSDQPSCVSMEDVSRSTESCAMTPPSSPKPTIVCEEDIYMLATTVFHQNRSHSDTSVTLAQSLRSMKKKAADEESATLVTEINEKYGQEQGLFLQEAAVFIKPLVSPVKQLPGKRGASGCLELLVLNDKHIRLAGDLSQLAPLVCNITELDLASNRIAHWSEVSKILVQMPLLSHCNLSQNPLSGPPPIEWNSANTRPVLKHMNRLVLNATNVRWDTLFLLLRIMPNLEELHLSMNNYGTPSHLPSRVLLSDEQSFPCIHIVHLNKCRLYGWEALARLCRLFPCLESLVASQNPISSLSHDPDDMKEVFGCLHSLNLNSSKLSDWKQVDALRHMPLLCELRLNQIPLLQEFSDQDRWNLVVARLPDITVFNGSQVGPELRLDAERFFLRKYADLEHKPERFYELERIHGQLEPLVNIVLKPKMMARVTIVFEEKEKREIHVITLQQTVGQFKKALQSFCGLPPSRLRVFYNDQVFYDPATGVHGCGSQELRYPNKQLYTLNVNDGDEFHIQKKPEPLPRRRTSSSTSEKSKSHSGPSA